MAINHSTGMTWKASDPCHFAPRSSAQTTWPRVIYSESDSVPIQASDAGSASDKKTTAVKGCKTELDFLAAVSMRAVKPFPLKCPARFAQAPLQLDNHIKADWLNTRRALHPSKQPITTQESISVALMRQFHTLQEKILWLKWSF